MSAPTLMDIVLYVAAGAALGGVYFALLLATARLHTAGAMAGRIIPLYVLRLSIAVGVFWLIAQRGGLPLVLALAGFLMARFAFQYGIGRV